MSRILIYTQQREVGGSLRMLLNLARHLASHHEVTIALPPIRRAQDRHGLLDLFPEIAVIDQASAVADAATFDMLVGHFPFAVDDVARADFPRKVAVIMEVLDRHRSAITNDDAERFDRIVNLHAEQVAELDDDLRERLCVELPVIDNIDFVLPHRTTGYLGSVGGRLKLDLPAAIGMLAHSPGVRGLRTYSNRPIRPGAAGLSTAELLRSSLYRMTGRLSLNPVELDLRRLYASFDCLLYTPATGNGTSVVVSDALACGRMVVVSPLETHRRAYSGLEGVYFLDEVGDDLSDLLRSYDTQRCERIRDCYRSHRNRDDVLGCWERALLS